MPRSAEMLINKVKREKETAVNKSDRHFPTHDSVGYKESQEYLLQPKDIEQPDSELFKDSL
jgi:hypothetical protein